MTIRLQIDRLEWDEWNLEHITKHDVTKDEIDAVVRSDFAQKESYKGRILITGTTATGRVLSVVVGQSPNRSGAYYVFSARPASRKERRELEEWRQR